MTHENNVREGREEAEMLPTRRHGIMWSLLIDLAKSVDKLEANVEVLDEDDD